MLINKNISVHTDKISLVPYSKRHVLRYHGWMKDPDLQVATASEQLTLEEEYAMQCSWRQDSDKLTFISCTPSEGDKSQFESLDSIVGDVNLFIAGNEEDSGEMTLVGELELMVAEKNNQHRGFGKASLLVFVKYILTHDKEILAEYFSQARDLPECSTFAYLRVKIGETNLRSLKLFEALGFVKTDPSPNFFGELELRIGDLSVRKVEELMTEAGIKGYTEATYPDEEDEQ